MRLSEDTIRRHAIEAPERRKAALGIGPQCVSCPEPTPATHICLEEDTAGEASCSVHAWPCCSLIASPEATYAR